MATHVHVKLDGLGEPVNHLSTHVSPPHVTTGAPATICLMLDMSAHVPLARRAAGVRITLITASQCCKFIC